MADNVAITPGAGATIATDEFGGVHYQVVKVAFGAANSATPVSASDPLPVTGPLTDTQLRASAVPVSLAALPALAAGSNNIGDVDVLTLPSLPAGSNAIGKVQVDNEPSATFRGRVSTFRTPGRAGTAGQKLFALHNATGSAKVVHIKQLVVDVMQTVVKAITVAPPVIRVHRFTALPSNGTTLTKTAKDTALSSNASVTAWGDASSDGNNSASALTVTIPAGSCLTQEFAARFITAAGYEMHDRVTFLEDCDIVLRALEGIVVFLDYSLATQNPTSDMWLVSCDWWEA